MEQIGETTFLLTANEMRILDVSDEHIELADNDAESAVERLNSAYERLQAMHAEDDKLLSHERAEAAKEFARLAIDKGLLNRIINQIPIDSEGLSPSDIIG